MPEHVGYDFGLLDWCEMSCIFDEHEFRSWDLLLQKAVSQRCGTSVFSSSQNHSRALNPVEIQKGTFDREQCVHLPQTRILADGVRHIDKSALQRLVLKSHCGYVGWICLFQIVVEAFLFDSGDCVADRYLR